MTEPHGGRFVRTVAAVAFSIASAAAGAELKPAALKAFQDYIRNAETGMDQQLGNGRFLWVAADAAGLERVRRGEIRIQPWSGDGRIGIPEGLIHDWVGSVFVPGAGVKAVLLSVQDYDRHKLSYKPEVLDSRLLRRNGDEFQVYLRLRKKKVLTVVLNTEHQVRYFAISSTRTHSRSYSTKIAELEHPGEEGERERVPGNDHGFLWRLYSYWRFEERDGGAYVECRAISLTRDVPTGLGWLITPIIRNLPKESLSATLQSTRAAVLAAR